MRPLLVVLAALAVFVLSLRSAGPAPALAAPANDNLANAVGLITPGVSGIVAIGTNSGATLQAGEAQPCGVGKTVWYQWTSPPSTGTVVIDTWGSDFDTVIAVYTGASYPLTLVACNDDVSPPVARGSALALSYAPNTVYSIQVGGYGNAAGNVVLNISTGAAMYVNTTDDNNTSDGVLSLREAMLLAVGGTGGNGSDTGLGRSLSAQEAALVLNATAAGAAGSDLVHFAIATGGEQTIALSNGLPLLSTGSDVISGIGTQVIIQGAPGGTGCFALVNNTGYASSDWNVIEGLDMRGCPSAGVVVLGNHNRIGGVQIPGQRNYISGTTSGGYGIMLGYSYYPGVNFNSVVGNSLGYTRDGLGAANGGGIAIAGGGGNIIGGSGPGEGNLISNNSAVGIDVGPGAVYAANGNEIKGNTIGTACGCNPGKGISLAQAYGTVIGGTGPGEANIIAFNGGNAIDLGYYTDNNSVRGNSIHSNGGGIGGVEAGDTPPPVISSVSANVVTGGTCPGCVVDIYSDTGGQGRLYEGGATADATGLFTATHIAHPLGNVTAIVTTAGSAPGSSSAFSAPVAAPTNIDGDAVVDAVDACPTVAEDEDGFQDTDGCPDYDNDQDGVCDAHFGGVVPAGVGCTGIDRGYFAFDPAMTIPGSYPLSPTLIDCSNLPEDRDGFHDGDGCPDPDNDNDGHPDVSDACPGTDTQTGPDNMLGAPQDLNHNGLKDATEALFTTDDTVLVFEDWDGVIDSDGCHDSPGDDFDGDSFGAMSGGMPSFRDEREVFLGTDPMHACAATSTANDEPGPDAWPVDFNDDQKVTLADVLVMRPVFNNPPAYATRYDFNADGSITLADVLVFRPFFNTTCVR